jgi:hypothetical protein
MKIKWKCRNLNWGAISAFAWRDWGEPRYTSVRIACVRAETGTLDLRIRRSANHSTMAFGIFSSVFGFSCRCLVLQIIYLLNIDTAFSCLILHVQFTLCKPVETPRLQCRGKQRNDLFISICFNLTSPSAKKCNSHRSTEINKKTVSIFLICHRKNLMRF